MYLIFKDQGVYYKILLKIDITHCKGRIIYNTIFYNLEIYAISTKILIPMF